MNKFRELRADEIDCRVAMVKENGCSLLLYKDARCDMNILDETVGEMNWQRQHGRDNANCIVSIWDKEKNQWISKEDTGTESYTEKEKGLASDSFKRACFNWGIGRELYTAPFIWIPKESVNIKPKGQNFTTSDRFSVMEIRYDSGVIVSLKIMNESMKMLAFSFPATKKDDTRKKLIDDLSQELMRTGYTWKSVYKTYQVENFESMTQQQLKECIGKMKQLPNKVVK